MASPTNPIERLDVTQAELEQQLRERALRRHAAKVARKQGRAGERRLKRTAAHLPVDSPYRHLIDGVDPLCGPLPLAHPEACTSDASYPGWAERLAELIAKSDSTRTKGTS
ncbi:hypothetical protein [Streptomyces sp. NPDC056682]|uniref:hypothetical protein n=1 Tax=Streptomyces sp. NPDC056682 TaxID=3345909 RepID=UPI0036C3B813